LALHNIENPDLRVRNPMEIDAKILEECAKIAYESTPNNEDWNSFSHYCPNSKNDLLLKTQIAIETYERLKPSPWLPIEEAPRNGTVVKIENIDGGEYYSRYAWDHWVLCDKIGTAFYNKDFQGVIAKPVRFKSIPKAPEEK
jgi:hypothetical protein